MGLLLLTIISEEEGIRSIISLGDINGDSIDDFGISTSLKNYWDNGNVRIYVIYGGSQTQGN
ncbi:MAG: hypothetical protein MRQ09_02150 [Candidatus Midichloria sp.]|nr:hypothetical protein [Candidatus Midichloria sp.]